MWATVMTCVASTGGVYLGYSPKVSLIPRLGWPRTINITINSTRPQQ